MRKRTYFKQTAEERSEDFKKKNAISEQNEELVRDYFELRFGCRCEKGPEKEEKYDDTLVETGIKMEVKTDFNLYDSGNIIMEIFNLVTGRAQWYYRSEMDILVYTEYPRDGEKHGWIRIYDWPALKEYLHENFREYDNNHSAVGGDGGMMHLWKVPLVDIEQFVIWKDDWDPPSKIPESKETLSQRRERIFNEKVRSAGNAPISTILNKRKRAAD